MNVFDFDGTIYDGDSSIDFYVFCLKKKPFIFVRCIGKHLGGVLSYSLKRISKERFKELFFSFVKYIPVNDELLNDFWDQHDCRIKQWYLDQKKSSDLIISASPEFLLKPICSRLGVSLIASKVDSATGLFLGSNCRGAEKVVRFREYSPDDTIDCFYTDSLSDLPMAKIADRAFLVKKDRIIELHSEDCV